MVLSEKGTVALVLAVSQSFILMATHFTVMNKNHGHPTCNNTLEHWYDFHPLLLSSVYNVTIISEIWIYIVITIFIYKSDRNVRPYISERAFKARKAKNIINFVGHLTHFVLELVTNLIVGVAYVTKQPFLMVSALVLYPCSSGIINLLMILLSPALKEELASLFQ